MERQKGITLISLVITIIILIILSAVSISAIVSDNGILAKAVISKDKTKEASVIEDIEFAWSAVETSYYEDFANNTRASKSMYFTKELLNNKLQLGTIEDDYIYNLNGNAEFTYKLTSTGTEYEISVDSSGNAKIM